MEYVVFALKFAWEMGMRKIAVQIVRYIMLLNVIDCHKGWYLAWSELEKQSIKDIKY